MTGSQERGSKKSIAVLLPCYNEERNIGKVIKDARKHLAEANIYVFDNRSTDRSAEIAKELGISVVPVLRRGKGFVVRAMLERTTEDVLVILDVDDTYDLAQVRKLTAPVIAGKCDMAVGARLENYEEEAFRAFHVFGNNLVTWLVNRLFGSNVRDVMSGYRAFTQEVARKVPLRSRGFDIEVEWTIQLITHGYRLKDINIPYRPRTEGSSSKLHTFRDGFRVLWAVFTLFQEMKPLTVFASLAACFYLMALIGGFLSAKIGPEDVASGRPPLGLITIAFFVCGLFFSGLAIILKRAAKERIKRKDQKSRSCS